MHKTTTTTYVLTQSDPMPIMMGPLKGPSKRWRPTPQQVRILDGLFRGGVTTPTAQEIQKITSQLKEYGKVESKNVFYWFQNHKAREKQKLNKKLHGLHHPNNNNNNLLFCFAYPYHHCSYGFWPILAPQATRRESVSAPEMRDIQWKNMEKQSMVMKEKIAKESDFDKSDSSSLVTWLAIGSDSDYQRHQSDHRRTLKTLQLFPTATSSETTPDATATSANTTTSSSSMNNS